MDALPFLARKSIALEPLYVIAGDEAFLKRLVLRRMRNAALGEEPDESAVSTYAGDSAVFSQVWDELETLPFFAPKRVVIVENADPFVTKYRGYLEKKNRGPSGAEVRAVRPRSQNVGRQYEAREDGRGELYHRV